jgi:hypothetical protein
MTIPIGAYQLAVRNVARHIRKHADAPAGDLEPFLDAFTASTVLAVAFCKSKEEVCSDIVHAEVGP